MLPVLFSIDKLAISSFGVFLAFGFIFGVFLIWRLSRAWDLNEESILDLTLLTFLGGLFGSRIYYVLENLQFFTVDFIRIFNFPKYPGFSFWGAFLGGWLTLSFFAKKKKLDFWQLADIAAVGFLGGLVFSSLGCFLGGCEVGVVSNSFLSVSMVGVAAKRFPVQIVEAILLLFVLSNLWSKSKKFHPRGVILSLSLIYIGLIKVLLFPLRDVKGESFLLPLVLTILGLYIFYKVTSRDIKKDLKEFFSFLGKLFTDSKTRKITLVFIKKSWYNYKTSISWQFRNWKKNLRRLNVKVSPKNH